MKTHILLLSALLACFVNSVSATKLYNDGPYLIDGDKTLMQYQINNNKLNISDYNGDLHIPKIFKMNEKDVYNNAEKIAAISDIHGQVDIFVQLLEKNGVIDAEHNWTWGKGHLVITGDIFDRGDTVTEALWLVYKLEQQAEKAGGKLHYLLGNHEYMVLRGDERYLHDKYINTLKVVNRDLKALFAEDTVLGRWLRSKSTVIKINGFVFLHGGIHQDFLDLNLSLEEANSQFRHSIGLSKKEVRSHDIYKVLHASTGPIWYRGFFKDGELDQKQIESVLKQLNAKRIVVGHTSMEQLETRFNDKILAIDASIKKGKNGELLIWRDNKFIRADIQGKQSLLFN